MNIAILHYSVPPIVGGVESVIGHHARLMSANGHAVRLIAGRGEALSEQIPLIKIPLADSRGDRIAKIKAELDKGGVTKDFDDLCNELMEQIQPALTDINVLIAHNVCSLHKNLALTAALHRLHTLKKLPRLILWHHDLAWVTPRYLSELHNGHPWDLLRTNWEGVDHVVVSEWRRAQAADLMKIDPASIRVISNGIDAPRFYKLEQQTQALLARTNILDSAPVLLLPVRVTPRKNIELALHTLLELGRQFPHAALVVTGPLGPHNPDNIKYFQMLLDLRAQLGLQDSAHFLAELTDSFLPDEVVVDFFRIADALVFPSREEGFGIPLLEAAFSHLPAFCADIPPMRELGLNDAVFFSPDESPARIAGMIAEYMRFSFTARLSMRARSSFRWESIYREQIAPLIENDGHV